ncbi:MAG: tryptophan-rich sensory protein [Fibrobacter sp.]|nr:tryptophan-rich sensory protein [Fibrobacter sp.]
MSRGKKGLKISLYVLICEAVGLSSGALTASSIPEWYSQLNKPSFSPPSWIFGPAWTVLYALMGIAAFLVSEKRVAGRRRALILFAVQLFLNFLWTILFFGLRSPLAAFMEIVLLLTAIILTFAAFWPISRKAALLLIPYIFWVSFASVLNFTIWKLNH